jgi:hypothetical protein
MIAIGRTASKELAPDQSSADLSERRPVLHSKTVIHDINRVASMRARVETGLANVHEMDVVKDKEFQEWLTLVRNWFNDLDPRYLKELSRSGKTPPEEAFWLNGAEIHLLNAEQLCGKLHSAFKKCGPGIRLIYLGP